MEGYALPDNPHAVNKVSSNSPTRTSIYPTKHPAVGHGWEINTGALAVKKSSMKLLEQWIIAFKENSDQFGSGDQQCKELTNTFKNMIHPNCFF
jgi:hypothetical protein